MQSCLAMLAGCVVLLMPVGKPVQIKASLGLPPALIPPDNPSTAETIAFGRRFFYDSILSLDNGVSCANLP